jgi:hypothetical protein
MNKQKWAVSIVTLLIVVGLGLTTTIFALGPTILFTDNILSTGTSQEVTLMEQELLNRINGASVSIDVAIYGFNRASVRDALIAAHERGVLVRVVTDDDAYDNASYYPYYHALETAGISVIRDNRSSLMHNKFFIIDGNTVWSGSTNQTDTGYTYNHNNSLLFDSTLMADIYSIEFDEMFEDGLFGTAKTDNVTHTIDYNGVPIEIYFSPSDNGMAEIIDEINTAQESVYFSIFFFTDDDLSDALINKANEGLTVEGIWDALGAANPYSEDETLCDAGIPIKIEDFGGKMHNKFMIIDANGPSPRVITGSMNWSASGDEANDENTLIIHDGNTAQAYLATYQELYNALGADTVCAMGTTGITAIYLPIIQKPLPTPTFTPTPMPTSTPVPTSTPMPTATNTPPPPPANVEITYILYNPSGDDVQGEYVRIQNRGGTAQSLAGWQLHDAATNAHRFYFPAMTLQPNGIVRVWTKSGSNTATDVYWGSGQAIWNNTGDTATLKNSNNQTVSVCSYPGGGVDYTCP